jgi:hypothetical protein
MGRGAGWEMQLRAWHQQYRQHLLADVVKQNPTYRKVGDKGWVPVADGPPDFLGFIAPNARGVAFDAKESRTARLNFKDIRPHQAVSLSGYQRVGVFSFIALSCSSGRYVVPWSEVESAYLDWRAVAGSPASILPKAGWKMDENGWLCRVP